jgi:N-acetyl sugar amidotransferase
MESTTASGPVTCGRCILDSGVPGVRFDHNGICNHCHMHDALEKRYAPDEVNRGRFLRLLDEIKSKGRSKSYDCIVGLSGGTDSTYCLYTLKQLGLRPLAVHIDNGWVSETAQANIARTVQKLGVDLKSVVLPWEQLQPLYRACLEASIPEMCLPCEVSVLSALYRAAAEEDVGYIVLGTSFRTEGINPLRWHYIDGAYFDDCARRSAAVDLRSRNLNGIRMTGLLYYVLLKRIRTIQLPLYLPYDNKTIWKTLETELGWQYGGRHHFDCAYKPFVAHIGITKFHIDYRKVTLSALVRSGQMTRDEALRALREDPYLEDQQSLNYCMDRLSLTSEEFEGIMCASPKDFRDYRSYYPLLSTLKLPVKMACRLNLVPETLYQKLFDVD